MATAYSSDNICKTKPFQAACVIIRDAPIREWPIISI